VKAAVDKAVKEFAGRGFRSLGIARADQDWLEAEREIRKDLPAQPKPAPSPA